MDPIERWYFNQHFRSQDIRSESIDYKRDYEHKHKWALGVRYGPGRHPTDPKHHGTPVKYSHSDIYPSCNKSRSHSLTSSRSLNNHPVNTRRQSRVKTIATRTRHSLHQTDDEFTYKFDYPPLRLTKSICGDDNNRPPHHTDHYPTFTGEPHQSHVHHTLTDEPHQSHHQQQHQLHPIGFWILPLAVEQAVQSFESRELDRVIREEYEVLNNDCLTHTHTNTNTNTDTYTDPPSSHNNHHRLLHNIWHGHHSAPLFFISRGSTNGSSNSDSNSSSGRNSSSSSNSSSNSSNITTQFGLESSESDDDESFEIV